MNHKPLIVVAWCILVSGFGVMAQNTPKYVFSGEQGASVDNDIALAQVSF